MYVLGKLFVSPVFVSSLMLAGVRSVSSTVYSVDGRYSCAYACMLIDLGRGILQLLGMYE